MNLQYNFNQIIARFFYAPLPDFPISLCLSSNTLFVCGPAASLSLLNLL
ncbi:hypothetical protein [Candidatus Rickettsia colombianensi]|nr:hypothetical protein [Candidatus Rickettsia colombianensi]